VTQNSDSLTSQIATSGQMSVAVVMVISRAAGQAEGEGVASRLRLFPADDAIAPKTCGRLHSRHPQASLWWGLGPRILRGRGRFIRRTQEHDMGLYKLCKHKGRACDRLSLRPSSSQERRAVWRNGCSSPSPGHREPGSPRARSGLPPGPPARSCRG
jgi:hypothetical protein